MFFSAKKGNTIEDKLYNKILSLSRNNLFYTKLRLDDTFENRINLIFFHISFIFIKLKQEKEVNLYKEFNQRMFDLVFNKIELEMREIGYGDTVINKNMKLLVKIFYNILLFCENYLTKNSKNKQIFIHKHFTLNFSKKEENLSAIVAYFNKYQAFCLDLCPDSVLKGDLNFSINKTLNI